MTDVATPAIDNGVVYLLYHFSIEACSDQDHSENGMKLIGIYTTESAALEAVDALRDKPGFRDWPGGFRVHDAALDHTSWTGGFRNDDDDDDHGPGA